MNSPSQIAEFYRNRSVFITGGTGFLGKVLIEKLLRSCPDIKVVYLLIRCKKGQSNVFDRLANEFHNHIVFKNLVRDQPEIMTKIIPIEGDVSLPVLGISQSDIQLLVENVSLVFNSAASIRFNEDMRTAVKMNVKGPQGLLHICQQMKNLDALVHVSTAFTNIDKDIVEEIVYPNTSISPLKLLNIVDILDDTSLKLITDNLLGKCPNTYIYTKGVAEQLLKEEKKDIPVVILRPSIVTGAAMEPIPGWIDNINGLTGPIVGGVKGFLQVMRSNSNFVGDIIPVDFTINLMIALAWYTANYNKSHYGIGVFHSCTGQQNPVKWGQLHKYVAELRMKFPCSGMVWYPNPLYVTSKYAYNIASFFFHYIPAFIIDFLALFVGKKTRLVYLYTKVDQFVSCTNFFYTKQWQFVSNNFLTVLEKMSEQDRRVFNFDVRLIDWRTYMKDYCLGCRRYILKEKDDTIPAALVTMTRLYWLQKAIHTLALLILGFIIYHLFY